MRKTGEEKIKRILEQNQVPDIREENVAALKWKVDKLADSVLFDILPPESFLDSLLRQVPYIAPWVWIVQLLVLILFAALFQANPGNMENILFLSLLGPILALLPAVDIARRFSFHMWEMEAACRHDLRQITAMHMCIIGGTDVAILTVGGCLCGRLWGSLWEFALFVILPFLVSSSVYLWELHCFSRRWNSFILAVTGIGLVTVGSPVLSRLYESVQWGSPVWMREFLVWLLAVLCAVTVYSAFRLCEGMQGETLPGNADYEL